MMRNMRTSASQFVLLVEFMERNGDLSKPAEGVEGRITNIKQWAELTRILNENIPGGGRSVSRWRKVWSDFKNNTKRKAAKCSQAINGTHTVRVKLTDLEERTLRLAGIDYPTDITEKPEVIIEDLQHKTEPNSMQTPMRSILVVPVHKKTEKISQYSGKAIRENKDTSNQPTRATTFVSTNTPIRIIQQRRSKRRVQPTASPSKPELSEASKGECTTDSDWRTHLIEMERRNSDLEAERLRLREIELQEKAQWRQLFSEFVSVLNRVATVFENK